MRCWKNESLGEEISGTKQGDREEMNAVKVNKKDLLKKVETNRDKHRDLFLKAQVGYRKTSIRLLDKTLRQAQKGKRFVFTPFLTLRPPVDQTQDYDKALAMLRMSVDKEVELDALTFENLVLDKWGWSQQVTATNTYYASRS
jgi:ASC-1-like (ASCH) protein